MKLAKADLVPKDTNLLPEYGSFAEPEAACKVFGEQVNTRVHRVTRRAPVDMLAEEQARLHRLPIVTHTVAFGLTRTVSAKTPMVAFEGGQYSVPHQLNGKSLLGEQVWVRTHGVGAGGLSPATPGSPRLDDAHFPPAPAGLDPGAEGPLCGRE